jgi:hypothetical protein
VREPPAIPQETCSRSPFRSSIAFFGDDLREFPGGRTKDGRSDGVDSDLPRPAVATLDQDHKSKQRQTMLRENIGSEFWPHLIRTCGYALFIHRASGATTDVAQIPAPKLQVDNELAPQLPRLMAGWIRFAL